MADARTLEELMGVHRVLQEMFDQHRDRVVLLDFPAALRALEEFEAALRAHMKDEEEVILPLYEERVGHVLGGDPQFFYVEHKNILRNLATAKEALRALVLGGAPGPREAHRFLASESLLMHLIEHHELREKNILYPALDRAVSAEERGRILARCGLPGPA